MKDHALANPPTVLGIALSHNGAACLMRSGKILCAVQEERLSRSKRDRIESGQNSLAVQYCLEHAGLSISEVDRIVVCLQSGRDEDAIRDILCNDQFRGIPANRISAIPHHLGHAMSAYCMSGDPTAAILVVDGAGTEAEFLPLNERELLRLPVGSESVSFYEGRSGSVAPLMKLSASNGPWLELDARGRMPKFNSVGGMYSAIAVQIFGNPMAAGKVMGLAPYGQVVFAPHEFYTWRGDELLFHSDVPDQFNSVERWPQRQEEYANLAASVQNALEELLLLLCERLRSMTDARTLCFAGGVALNGVANARIAKEAGFNRLYIPAAAEDSGTAVGAAYFGEKASGAEYRPRKINVDYLGGAKWSPDEMNNFARLGLVAETDYGDDLYVAVARRIAQGEVVGWVQGRSELGPRALGGRSLLADARDPSMKDRINGRIKRREDFRPFAPVILAERAHEYFEKTASDNPFMLQVWKFLPGKGELVPAVRHVDGTGRVQTVSVEQNPAIHKVLASFEEITGIPILLNTSFNGPGEPIVETPHDAVLCAIENNITSLVVGETLYTVCADMEAVMRSVPALRPATKRSLGIITDDELTRSPKHDVMTFTPWGEKKRRITASRVRLLRMFNGLLTADEVAQLAISAGLVGSRLEFFHEMVLLTRQSFLEPLHRTMGRLA